MDPRFAALTDRQRACLRGKWDRKLDKAIAAEMGVSQRAVEEHLRAARGRLGASSSLEAARSAALVFGWVDTVAPQCGPTELPEMPASAPIPPYEGDGHTVHDAGWHGSLPHRLWSGRPYRTRGGYGNDLTLAERSVWILALGVGIPAALVLVLASADYAGRLVQDIAHLTS